MLSLLGWTAFRPASNSARIFAAPLSSTLNHLRLSSLRAMTTKVRVGSVDLLNDGQMQVCSAATRALYAYISELTVPPIPPTGLASSSRSRHPGLVRRQQEGNSVPERRFGSQDLALESQGQVLCHVVKVHALRRTARQGRLDRRGSPRLVSPSFYLSMEVAIHFGRARGLARLYIGYDADPTECVHSSLRSPWHGACFSESLPFSRPLCRRRGLTICAPLQCRRLQ